MEALPILVTLIAGVVVLYWAESKLTSLKNSIVRLVAAVKE